jgi:hypothetical protein
MEVTFASLWISKSVEENMSWQSAKEEAEERATA